MAGSDFAGEGAEVRYAVRLELLHAGNNYGELRIRGLYEELRIPVHVKLPGDPEREIRSSYERDMLQFHTCYLKQMAGEYEEQPVLVSMQSALARAYSAYVSGADPLYRRTQRFCRIRRSRQENIWSTQGKNTG
ncbi:MAG: DUF5717 family protein [Lachnospiraceae bacterium]